MVLHPSSWTPDTCRIICSIEAAVSACRASNIYSWLPDSSFCVEDMYFNRPLPVIFLSIKYLQNEWQVQQVQLFKQIQISHICTWSLVLNSRCLPGRWKNKTKKYILKLCFFLTRKMFFPSCAVVTQLTMFCFFF